MNSFVSAVVSAEFASNNFLDEIARKQWQADLVGGAVAQECLVETERALADAHMNRNDLRYINAYNTAQQKIA